MGGGSSNVHPSPSENESSSGHDSTKSSVSSGDDEGLSHKTLFPDVDYRTSSILEELAERQRDKAYAEIMSSYEDLPPRILRLEEAKTKLLSYKPGLWAEIVDGVDLNRYEVPKTTSLGPKGSGKSSLVNKISRVLEDDVFRSERAQVSYNSSTGDGTYFLHEYTIPRKSGSFCLYDTRSLSDDLSENRQMLDIWMTMGVAHGELVRRNSDSTDLKAQLKCKARRRCSSRTLRPIDFVIFVVNGVSVLESMDSFDEDKKRYSQMIAENFKNPMLSFKDDKPVVVVTHGDLLSISDRTRVRIHLGELFGIPPTTQVFDIPESADFSTELAIADMLIFCLDRADRNLPTNEPSDHKHGMVGCFLLVFLLTAILLLERLFALLL